MHEYTPSTHLSTYTHSTHTVTHPRTHIHTHMYIHALKHTHAPIPPTHLHISTSTVDSLLVLDGELDDYRLSFVGKLLKGSRDSIKLCVLCRLDTYRHTQGRGIEERGEGDGKRKREGERETERDRESRRKRVKRGRKERWNVFEGT